MKYYFLCITPHTSVLFVTKWLIQNVRFSSITILIITNTYYQLIFIYNKSFSFTITFF